MSNLPFRIIPRAERVSIAPCPINHYWEEGSEDPGLPKAQRTALTFTGAVEKCTTLSLPKVKSQWRSHGWTPRRPRLCWLLRAAQLYSPAGLTEAPLWFLNKTKGQSASRPVCAVFSCLSCDNCSIFMIYPNIWAEAPRCLCTWPRISQMLHPDTALLPAFYPCRPLCHKEKGK